MKLVRESLYNFQKTGDVKSGLNIGIRAKIKAWLDDMEVENYTINDDYSIDVDGNVYLGHKNLESFPDYIKFNMVIGSFYCDYNQLTSLKGAPKKVEVSFSCDNNQLTSLEGAPKEVGGHFSCSNNGLTSLEGAPKEVSGGFYCYNNQLTSLDGAPNEVGIDFYCRNNKRKFSKEEVLEVCNLKGRIYT